MPATTNLCPRCHQPFLCKPDDVVHCDCTHVQLSEGTLAFLQKTTYGCLCNACLIHFEKLFQETENIRHLPMTDLKEGVHYYIEDGRWVFTERYHMLKGYCCENGCRHCVYGFNRQA